MTAKKDICCPTCNKTNTWLKENEYKPFCSARCKLIDLGAWANEDHRIPGGPADFTQSDKTDKNNDEESNH